MVGKKDIGEGLGISGFTLGVLSIIMTGWIGIVIAIVGFSFCYSQQRKKSTRLGKTGMILNIIGIIVSIAFLVLFNTLLAPFLQQGTIGG